MKDPVIVINGYAEIAALDRKHAFDISRWGDECTAVHASFKKKTSRKEKGGQVYEYTNWYRIKGDGSLESVGKEEPDYKQYYPPEPKPPYSFKVVQHEGYVILDESDYLTTENRKLFHDCLAFKLEDCLNHIHPLYKNPEKALKDSVRKGGGLPGKISDQSRTEKEDLCRGDGDCEECEHLDECPVSAEE